MIIDKSQFKLEAVVDFVKVRVDLDRHTNFHTVRSLTRATYVESHDEGPGGAASAFTLRFDDPPTWKDLQTRLEALSGIYGFVAQPSMQELEVSLDAYCRDGSGDIEKLADLAAHFFQFKTRHESDNVRIYRRTGEVESANTNPDRIRSKLLQGHMVGDGNTFDPLYGRIYVKRTDGSGKIVLPQAEWRARYEWKFSGNELPFHRLSDAAAFRFEDLAKLFKFREPKPGGITNPIQALVAGRAPALGARAENPGLRSRRHYSPFTKADKRLNAVTYEALKALTRRMNRV